MMGSSSTSDRRAALLRQAVDRPPSVVPNLADWPTWSFMARLERAVPLLYQLVDRSPTDLVDGQREELRQLFGVVMCRCVELEHHALRVSQLLGRAGVRNVLLKGLATSHLDYADPNLREFGDVDILVSPDDLARAIATVEADGWVQGYSLHPGHLPFTHAVTFVRGGIELDLHQRVAHRALGRLLPTDELIERARPFEIAGTEVLALDELDRFVHSAVHSVASGQAAQRVSSLADVLLVATNRSELAPSIIDRADAHGVRRLVERGVREAFDLAQLTIPSQWGVAMERQIRRRVLLVDHAYGVGYRRPVSEELAHMQQLDGWSDRVRYVRGFFVGDRSLSARLQYVWAKLRGR
jgi:hypothetical protein